LSRIFISYRRDDAAADAGRLSDVLTDELGPNSVYKDVDDVPLGVSWRAAVRQAIRDSAAVLAVIGPSWTQSPAIEIELRTAFDSGIRVIPVLVRNANMPTPEALSSHLADFSDLNAASLDHATWNRDVGPLIETVRQALDEAQWNLMAIEGMTEGIAERIRNETRGVLRFGGDKKFARYAGIAPPRQVPFNGRLYDAILALARTQRRGSGPGQRYYRKRVEGGWSELEAELALARYISRRVYRCLLKEQTG
jgi:hypothetical protein